MKTKLITGMLILLQGIVYAQQNALDFDNVDDYVTVPNASAGIANETAISLSCWVYPENTNITFPDYDGFAGFRNNIDADFYMIQHVNTSVEARFRNNAGTAYDVVVTNLVPNTWQHYVMTYNGSTLTLYRNGLSVGSTAASGTISSSSEIFYIGNLLYQATNFYFNGKIDEVSLWRKALTAQEVSCIYNNHVDASDPSLVLYYKFNQGIPNGNNATINNLQNSITGTNGTLLNFAKNGTTSNFVPGVIKGTVATDTICPGDSVVFGSMTITQSGNYIQSFQTPSICDSIVELQVSVSTVNTSVTQNSTTLTAAQAGAVYQWIDCNNGNAPITNAVQQAYAPTANGSYAVIVTVNSCSDTSSCIPFTTSGIESADAINAAVFPNPFKDELYIQPGMRLTNAVTTVFDATGKAVYNVRSDEAEHLTISTSGWNAGIYILEIRSDEGSFRKRLEKQ